MISRFLALLLVLHLSLMQVFASQVDSQSVDIEGSSTGIDVSLNNFGVGVNVQTQEAEGDRTNVGTQAAIRAQDGFDIDVEGTTTLEGGVIEGSDNPENNSLETGNLEFSDVDVGSQFSAETSSAGINSNGSLNIAPTQEEEGSDSGTVRSAISQGEIEITNPDSQTQDIASLSRDTDNTNVEIEALPDLEQTLADQATVIANYQASVRFVAQTTSDIADALEKQARERGDTETAELFKEGGVGRALLHAAGGALVGGIDGGTAAIAGGAAGGFTASLVGPLIDEAVREALAEQGVTDFSEGSQGAYFRNLLTSVLTTGVAGAAGGNAGAAFGSSVDAYNRLLHRSEIELIQDNAVDFAIEQGLCTSPASCTQEDIDQARGILTAEALSQVDGAFVGLSGNDAAQTFLAGLGQGNAIEGTGQFLFQASGADFNNTALNSEFLIDNSDLYDAATVYGNKPYSNVVDTLTTALANVRQDQSLAPQSVAQLRGQIADLDEAEFRDLLFTTSYNNGDGANVVGLLATQLVLEASQTRPDFQSVLFETIREVGEQQQEDREEIIAIADGIANKISNGEALTADEAIFSATFLAAGASNSLRGLPKLLKSAVGQRLSRIFGGNRGADGFYDPRAWRENYEDFYSGDVTSTTVPPYSAPNVRLAGQRHPETGIVYDQRGFPIFDDVASYDTRFPSDQFRATDYRGQMRIATRDLRDQLNDNPQLRSQFEPDQLQAIQSGSENIPRLTWHHHQDAGRMQLVPRDTHRNTAHIGGGSISSGQ